MQLTKAKVPGTVAVAVLAVLTLSVFYVLQDYGPASAIRRFHMSVVNNDARSLQQVVDEPITDVGSQPVDIGGTVLRIGDVPITDRNVGYLIGVVRLILVRGGQPQLARIDRQGASVHVAVVYHLPGGDTRAIIWIVDKQGSLWKINSGLTAALLEDSIATNHG